MRNRRPVRVKLAEVFEQTPLHIAFVRIIPESEEIEIVRIFGDVLREIGLWRWKRAVEIGNRFPLPVPPLGLNLVNKDIATPSMLNGGSRVPNGP